MAKKRMFTMQIVDSDAFLDMPLSAQCLYFHFNMRADDDGFIGNPKKIMRIIGAKDDDLKILLAKRFLLDLDNGIIVIKHWWMHNTLAKDRYHETAYLDEKSKLRIKENKAYTLCADGIPLTSCNISDNKMITECKQIDNKMLTECLQNDNTDIDIDIDIDKDLGLVQDLDKEKDKDLNLSFCSEQTSCSEPDVPKDITISLILNDNSLWTPTQEDIQEYSKLYPNVDVISELRRMRGWCIGNPKKRKTKNGIKRFVHNWLGGQQDKPSRTQEEKKGNYRFDMNLTSEEYRKGNNDPLNTAF